jgi:hypothetical protein
VRPSDTGDAGYVRLDDFAGLETALSFGINDDAGRDRGGRSRYDDHRSEQIVDDAAPDDPRTTFNKKMIAP